MQSLNLNDRRESLTKANATMLVMLYHNDDIENNFTV